MGCDLLRTRRIFRWRKRLQQKNNYARASRRTSAAGRTTSRSCMGDDVALDSVWSGMEAEIERTSSSKMDCNVFGAVEIQILKIGRGCLDCNRATCMVWMTRRCLGGGRSQLGRFFFLDGAKDVFSSFAIRGIIRLIEGGTSGVDSSILI